MNQLKHWQAFTIILSGLLLFQSLLFIKLHSLMLLAVCLTALTGFGANLIWYRQRAGVWSGHILNIIFILYVAVLCYNTGGLYSVGIFMLFFIPLLVSVFDESRDKLIYLGGACALILINYLGHLKGSMMSQTLVNISIFRFYHLITLFGCFSAAMFYHFHQSRKVEHQLMLSRQQVLDVKEDTRALISAKDAFLANMSHEIRNPMNGIIGMMHVLLDSDLDEEQRNYADIVYSSARALLSIVNDILDLSKIEAGKLELDIRGFDLELAIKDIVSLPALQARQKGITFSHSIDSIVPCKLKGDIARIRQVILNLTGNAVKFTETGEITLFITLESETKASATIKISVEDTGIGIKTDQIDQLFESFTQADLSITKQYGGTGLGLTISKLLVEKMNGRIGAESIEMVGSTFWFTLTLDKQTEEELRQDHSKVDIEKVRVMVISDGATLGRSFEKNLGLLNIDYEQAFDETEAIEMLRWAKDEKNAFDLVIMEAKEYDIVCENLSRKMAEDGLNQKTRYMLLTSVGKKGDARRFEELGFSAFLSKPVERSLLAETIQAVLSRPVFTGSDPLPIITRYSILEKKKHLRRILIVEDMETNLLMAKALIEKMGYQTAQARNGQEAFEMHTRENFDLILMDCQMPVMDGYEATRTIREHEQENSSQPVPIVAMTGNAFEKDRRKCFDAGMDDFIAKPVEPDILSEKIRSNLTDPVKEGGTSSPEPSKPSEDQSIEDFLDTIVPEIETAGEAGAAESIEHAAPLPAFDRQTLSDRFGGDEELMAMVIDSFLSEAPELMTALSRAVQDSDMEEMRVKAHALKGTAANVNAERLRNVSFELENAARQEDTSLFKPLFEKVEKELNRFVDKVSG